MNQPRIYRHFCMMARALEIVGERWSLLIVRDLLLGPRRFTDLARSLSEITPTRLTNRLRQLEAAGLVSREPPATGREVWYRLTDAGADLGPVVEALIVWGIEHALEPPLPGEPAHPAAVMIGSKVFLSHQAQLAGPVVWVWRFADDTYTLRFDESVWTLSRGEAVPAEVIVDSTLEAWARFLTARRPRKLPHRGIRLTGTPAAIRDFAAAFAADGDPG